ncbi:MAG: hypothetical protein ACRDQF_19240, partial [Thermocrispum sp.]
YRAVKARSFVRNLRDAVKLLERYRREYTTVVTSRLHCYLPARSLGGQVVFQPKSRADVRFNGLIDIDDAAFDKIRGGMLARLEPVLSAILAGGGEDEVYALWRELCADDVEATRQRHDSVLPLPAHTQQVQRATGKVAAAASHHGRAVSGAVDVVIPVGSDDVDPVRRTVESVLAKASRPVRLWLPSWGLEPADRAAVVDACGDAAVTWLPCDGLSADEATVLLPELLGEAASAVLLPPAAVVLGDIAALADRDLGGRALAARTSLGTAASGFGRLYRAAKRLHPDAELAHELFLRMHARHRFDFDAFDPQVLVLDLARLRADDMSAELLPYLERFGLTAAEALLLYTGPDRDVLPPEWAHAPVNERLADPQLVQWPGSAKPWQRPYVAGRQYWQVSSAR